MNVTMIEENGWDVFLAHAGPDLTAASELADELTKRHGLRCFLDADRLRPGHGWPIRLKKALVSSKVIAVVVSEHSDEAFYLQEEVAIAVFLYRKAPDARRVLPVLRREAGQEHLPYGTFALHAVREDDRGWPPVADAIQQVLASIPGERALTSLANSVRMLDHLWAGLERALTDQGQRMPTEYRVRFVAEGDDLLARQRDGRELQRVTREDLETRLTEDELRHLSTLEKSMEVNLALWEARYPDRVLDKRSRRAAEEAADALAEDLSGVLGLVERSGLWLDDHYLTVRGIAEDRIKPPS